MLRSYVFCVVVLQNKAALSLCVSGSAVKIGGKANVGSKMGLVGVVTTPTIIPHSHKTTHVAGHSDNGYFGTCSLAAAVNILVTLPCMCS